MNGYRLSGWFIERESIFYYNFAQQIKKKVKCSIINNLGNEGFTVAALTK